MDIVFSHKDDIPEIVDMLKKSLGENLVPKTVEYFIWKHYKNPFGQSIILVAKKNDKIIGVRAFMKWEWCHGEKKISSVRAVDTATDPAHHGRGIFKKLTLMALEECKKLETVFVFNTPNKISMKGYLKMGWHSIGRMPLDLCLATILPRRYDKNKIEFFYQKFKIENQLNKLGKDWSFQNTECITTKLNLSYLTWRYADCPIVKYGALIEPGKFGIIFRLKKINLFCELRICDFWVESPAFNNLAQSAINNITKMIRPIIVTKSFLEREKHHSTVGEICKGIFSIGPLTTVRSVVENDPMAELIQFKKWAPSLGSMELF